MAWNIGASQTDGWDIGASQLTPSGSNYTLTADSGTFTLTGQDVTLTYAGLTHYTLTADSGSFTQTGSDADLIYSGASRTLTADSGTFTQTGSDADLYKGIISDIRFNAGLVPYDSITATTGTGVGTVADAYFANLDIQSETYRVHNYLWGESDVESTHNHYYALTLPVSNLSTFSVLAWLRIKGDNTGAIFLQRGNNMFPRVISGGRIDNIGDDAPVTVGYEWGEYIYRQDGGTWEILWNNSIVASGSGASEVFVGGDYYIAAHSALFTPEIDLARVAFFDNWYTDTVDLVDDLNNSSSTYGLLGQSFREEEDGGANSAITVEGQDAFDISFPGTVCWGASQGYYPEGQAIRLKGTVSYDTFVQGTGHISTRVQIAAIFADKSRSAYRAQLYGVYNLITDTIDSVELLVSDGITPNTYTVGGAVSASTAYNWDLIKTDDEIILNWNGTFTSYPVSITDNDFYMIGLNLGIHFDTWTAHYTNIVYELYPGYILAAEEGSYTLTGSDATLTYGGLTHYTLTADGGTFTLTGSDADLIRSFLLSADSDSYALTGSDVDFSKTYKINADSGLYNLTGYDVTLTYSGIGPIEIITFLSKITLQENFQSQIILSKTIKSDIVTQYDFNSEVL